MTDFTKLFQLKGLKPKNNGQTNFYECCDLTKKVYLIYIHKYTYMYDIIEDIVCKRQDLTKIVKCFLKGKKRIKRHMFHSPCVPGGLKHHT